MAKFCSLRHSFPYYSTVSTGLSTRKCKSIHNHRRGNLYTFAINGCMRERGGQNLTYMFVCYEHRSQGWHEILRRPNGHQKQVAVQAESRGSDQQENSRGYNGQRVATYYCSGWTSSISSWVLISVSLWGHPLPIPSARRWTKGTLYYEENLSKCVYRTSWGLLC